MSGLARSGGHWWHTELAPLLTQRWASQSPITLGIFILRASSSGVASSVIDIQVTSS